MITSLTLLILSFAALYIGANWLIQGSVDLAFKANISRIVVGLTIGAFGTSTPELIVSLQAILAGQGDIAIGNVVGSNIFNIAFILGVSAIITPLQGKRLLTRIDIPLMVLATILLTVLFWNGRLGRFEGGLFFFGIILYTFYCLYYSRKYGKTEKGKAEELEKQPNLWYINLLYIVGGMAILLFASQLLVKNAVSIAHELGVNEAIIGLTVVAAGTSVPELIISVVAVIKKNPDIAIGNIVGSNLFNILAVAGLSALVHPIQAKNVGDVDLLVMLGLSVLLLPLLRGGQKISRIMGGVLIVLFIIYWGWLFHDLV